MDSIVILNQLGRWRKANQTFRKQILFSNYHAYNCHLRSQNTYTNFDRIRTGICGKVMKTFSRMCKTDTYAIRQLPNINGCNKRKGFHYVINVNRNNCHEKHLQMCSNELSEKHSNYSNFHKDTHVKSSPNLAENDVSTAKHLNCTNATLKLQKNSIHPLTNLSCHGYHTSSRKYSFSGDTEIVRSKPPWRVLFFGTDLISLCTLKALHSNLTSSGSVVDHLEVVTVKNQDNKLLPVHKFSTKAGLPTHVWPVKVPDHSAKYDVGVLVSFGHLIPERVINLFPYGIINMHPSLLPRWRGASPVFHTVLNGDTETGVSISEIRPKHFDVGPILMQKSVPVHPHVTTGDLTNQLANMGASMVLDCLQDLPNLERLEHEQEPRGITYAHKVHPIKAGYVNWSEETPTDIDHHFRAVQGYGHLRLTSHFQNGEPVAFNEMVDINLTKDISSTDIQFRWGDFHNAEPGCIALHRKEKWLLVKCKNGMVGFTKVVCRSNLTGSTFYYGFCNHKHIQQQFKSEDNMLNEYVYMEKIPVTG